MKVLSLFDGISCGRVALERIGIRPEAYYASEIDKHAIKVSNSNWDDITRVGDVTLLNPEDFSDVDLLIGGSPCQGFSAAGKQLNFEDPRSALFFEYVRLLRAIKPKHFVLENVKMKREWEQVITEYMGVEPLRINSNCFSAQNRERLYWCSGNPSPPNSCVLDNVGSILEEPISGAKPIELYPPRDPVSTSKISGCVFVGGLEKPTRVRGGRPAGTISSFSDRLKVYSFRGKSPCLTTKGVVNIQLPDETVRQLSVREWCKLQTLPPDYCSAVSNSQAYKALGNGWTVDVIAFLLKQMLL